MKLAKKLLSLICVAAMVFSMAACAPSNEDESKNNTTNNKLEWLNTDGGYPIVKEGYEKTLKIYVEQTSEYGDPKDSWMFKYIEEVLNIKLDITVYTKDNKSEFLSLAFASNELPDIIIGANFSTAELLNYGEVEEQILDLAPYINQTYMPNLYSIYQSRPELKSYVTTAAGNVWSLGRISSGSVRGGGSRWFMNYDWLEQCNLEVPTTLDEFINVMRTFKQKGLCEYPIGGGYASEHPGAYILNAMGYVGANSKAYAICLRNGKVVMPLADREAFGDYLKVMNQLYTDGLIHPDFFTMDRNSIYATFAENVGFIMQAPFVATEDYSEYWSALPLTSKWNDTAVVPGNTAGTYGGVIVSADTENPELCAKFIDAFYGAEENNLYHKSLNGPAADETDILYGLSGWTLSDGVLTYADYENSNGKYASTSEYTAKYIQLWLPGAFGYASWECGDNNPYFVAEPDASKYEDASVLRKDPIISGNGDKHYEFAQQTVLTPYVTTDIYPSAVYMDAEQAAELAQTLSALRSYAKAEIAKFITGARALTDAELDDYFTNLEKLGSKEYVQAYQDYYDSLNK